MAIDEKSAFLVEADGKGVVVGNGKGVYFMAPAKAPDVCKPATPLTFQGIAVNRVTTGGHFDLTSWSGEGGTAYTLSVVAGKIESSQANKSAY